MSVQGNHPMNTLNHLIHEHNASRQIDDKQAHAQGFTADASADSAIPRISSDTLKLMEQVRKLMENNRPVTPLESYTLREKTKTFEETVATLKDATTHETRNKVLGVLKALLWVAILVGGIFGALATAAIAPGIAVGIIISTCLILFALSNYYAYRLDYIGGSHSALIGLAYTIVGFAFPIYEEFGKVKRLEANVEQQKEPLLKELARVQEYFSQDLDPLTKAFQARIQVFEKLIQQATQSIVSTQELVSSKNQHSQALAELTAAIAYYQKHPILEITPSLT
jgi:hypothetical protein